MASWGDRDPDDKKLAELAANQENGWEILASSLRELFGKRVSSEDQAKREATKLLEDRHGE